MSQSTKAVVARATSIAPKTVPTSAAEAIVAASTPTPQGVTVQASLANTSTVYVGGPTVSTTNGIELNAGDSVHVSVSDASGLYCISTVVGQVLRLVSP